MADFLKSVFATAWQKHPDELAIVKYGEFTFFNKLLKSVYLRNSHLGRV